jgi:beta-glucosidase
MAKIPIFLVGFWLLSTWAGLLETDEDIIKYKNPKESVNIRVEDLINRMTLDEKIGQMLQIERKYASNGVIQFQHKLISTK